MEVKQFFRAKEVAERLGIGRSTVYHYVQIGLLPAPIKLSQKVSVWSDETIREFIERARGGAQ